MPETNSENIRSIKIHVADLRLGMYVSKLDKDWLDTPFLYQGFLIEQIDDIVQLEQHCEHVWIDPAYEPEKTPGKQVLASRRQHQARYINKISMPKEYQRSYDAFYQARQTTKSLLDDIVLGDAINTEAAKRTVKTCVDSILRNPSAMLWMSKMRETNSYTSEHCLNVCILAIAFGRYLGKDDGELELLGMCGLLHDVGKMRVSQEIIDKPDKLTPKEWKSMQAHVVHGRNLLMTSTGIGYTVDVAYSHHERIDGKGYPRQLTGAQLSEQTKMIAIVDAYDAMTANRCYAPSITPSRAIKNIYQDRGTHFDDRLALQFIKMIGLYPPGTVVELMNGLMGVVMERHERYQHLPKVLIARDDEYQPIKKKLVDLSQTQDGSLSRRFLIRNDHPDGYANIYLKDFKDYLQAIE